MKFISIFLILITIALIFILYFGNETIKLINTQIESRSLTFQIMLSKPSKYALMAVNIDETNKTFYFFYLPFVAQAWKRLGFLPIVLLITTQVNDLKNLNGKNLPAAKTVKYLSDLGVNLKLIKSDREYGLITSMISRLFVGALDFLDEEDYILTSDSDLIPINSEYYEIENLNAITVWNSECCGYFIYKNISYKMYPMGHTGMKKKHWKGVMSIRSNFKIETKTIRGLVSSFYSQNYVKKDFEIGRGDATWNADQAILSQKIGFYSNILNKTKIVHKPYRGIRLDRSQSSTTLVDLVENKFSKLTDYHAFHSNFLDKWNVTSALLKKMFKNNHQESFLSYYNEFKKTN